MSKRGIALILGAAAVAAALVGFDASGGGRGSVRGSAGGSGVPAAYPRADPLAGEINQERAWVAGHPDDTTAWALLAAGYVERTRVTADPTYLTKADDVLTRTMKLPAAQGDSYVLDARAALAASRHRFVDAADLARGALIRRGDDWMAWGVLSDADVQLGRYDVARGELQKMMDTRPGVPAYTRAAHYFAITGDIPRAEQALALAASAATAPADVAFCYQQLGEVEWQWGRVDQAESAYELALRADPGYPMALGGRARVEAARGKTAQAIDDYQTAINRAPYPLLILEFGDLLTARGRHADAAQQFAVFQAEERLLAAAGVGTPDTGDLLTAGQYLANYGDPARAVAVLTVLWGQAPSVETADAYAWALHRAGRDRDALPIADQAMRLNGYKALYAFHRGEIERALGQREAARSDLSAALHRNAQFSPLWTPVATKDLVSL